MDVGTQALASFAVARAVVPRAPWSAWGVIVVAGVIANVDYFASMSTPIFYINWHRTYAHSILVSLLADAVLAAAYLFFTRSTEFAEQRTQAGAGATSAARFFIAV